MIRELVVAHFNEDLSWIPKEHQVSIYSKGEPAKHHRSLPLPNIGREGHTFVTHIIECWNCLADVTIFVQGDPLFHCELLLKRLDQEVEWFEWMTDMVFKCNADGTPDWDQDVGSWYEKLMGREFPGEVSFGVGGQFAATRECIRSVGLGRWRWIKEQSETDPLFPWMMERTWGALLEKQHAGMAS